MHPSSSSNGQSIYSPLLGRGAGGEAFFVLINDQLQDLNLDEVLQLLSDQRREQALCFRHDLGRRTCAAAYLLLCEGLRRYYGIAELPLFSYGEHGKPTIVGHPDIHFNLSHCREAAICVLADRPVGVDIETIRPLREALMRHTMNDDEVQQILVADNPALAFTRLWTMKEAVVKRSGRGITDDLKHVLQPLPEGLTTVVGPDARYVYSYV